MDPIGPAYAAAALTHCDLRTLALALWRPATSDKLFFWLAVLLVTTQAVVLQLHSVQLKHGVASVESSCRRTRGWTARAHAGRCSNGPAALGERWSSGPVGNRCWESKWLRTFPYYNKTREKAVESGPVECLSFKDVPPSPTVGAPSTNRSTSRTAVLTQTLPAAARVDWLRRQCSPPPEQTLRTPHCACSHAAKATPRTPLPPSRLP